MTVQFWQYLIVCPLVFVAGLIDAIAGGGGLISLPAYMIAGVPTHAAIATNKLSATMGTTVATVRYGMAGYIPWKIALAAAVLSVTGAQIGSRLSLLVPEKVLTVAMLVILPLVAVFVFFSKSLFREKPPLPKTRTILIVSGISFAIGLYDGFYGPGTGTFLIVLFSVRAHMDMKRANGVTKVANLASNVSSLVTFLLSGNVILLFGFVAGLFGIGGNFIGTVLFKKKTAAIVKPVMILVLVIFFVKVLWELLK